MYERVVQISLYIQTIGQNVAKPTRVFRSHLLKFIYNIELGYSFYRLTSKLLSDFCKITTIAY